MYEYIKGNLVEATPTYAIVDNNGIAYIVNISVNTYSQINTSTSVLLYLYQIVREDAHLLYGFYTKEERVMFKYLISVSGIGANTANVMLSSMTVNEIAGAIMTENVNAIKSVKGIGLKTAQRVIIELKDKVVGVDTSDAPSVNISSTIKEEAMAALLMLGFVKNQVSKALDKIISDSGVTTVEELIKLALKQL